MFEILFGWRKASTCKKLIRRVQCRLKLLKNKRDSIVRQLIQDVVQLIKSGHEECAFTRIEQLYKDQNVKAVYDLIDNFCEFIIINISYIRRHRDCPNDINEAVSSLLYASARCGDLPELIKLRKLFGERYGQKFALTAVELHHGNLVNRQIIENLRVKSIPDDFKIVQLKEIARDNDLQLHYHEFDDEFKQQQHQQSVLSKENYVVEWIERESDRDIQFTYDGIDGSKFEASYANELQEIVKSTAEWKTTAESPQSCTGFGTKSNTIGATAAAESAPDLVQAPSSNLNHKTAKDNEEMDPFHEAGIDPYKPGQNDCGRCNSSLVCDAPLQHKLEKVTGTASESPTHFSDRSIVYLDDVEELQPSMSENVKDRDQRLFMFKSNIHSVRTNRAATTTSFSGIYQDHVESCEPSDGKSSSRGASKRPKSVRKRLKQRYALVENMSMKDVECALYYGEPDYSSPDDDLFSMRSYPERRHQRKISNAESLGSPFTNNRKKLSSPRIPNYFYAWRLPEDIKQNISPKGISNPRVCGTGNFSHDKTVDCSLDHPCYFVISDNKDDRKLLYKARHENKTLKEVPCISLQQENCEDIQRGRSSSDEAFITNINSNSKHFRRPTDKAIRKEMEDAEVIDCRPSCASSHDSYSRVSSPWTHVRPPYLRALTMPPERPKVTPTCNIIRSSSCLPKQQNIGSPSFIHPKLPDYDDLTAKFKALREELVIG
ncbi:Regulator of vps4 activity in the mvb pathway protein [Thalictrum thalictroides]|uniref:Regulator of vps4 activity in the mvb pathway protein n=1 Tax=Thalictrum thalictroides TaxID=46969 RepID=A0A7J6URG3_THATH|nr:Regulator of vps4 activity in the mvb pathway protein [Thalictrum thalictroides]